jgi:hypothetical protein
LWLLYQKLQKKVTNWGLIVALPLVTILAMIWLHVEKQPMEKIANHAWYTFWYLVPTLPMFLLFPMLLQKFGLWLSLIISAVINVIFFWLFALVVKGFGIDLLP